MSESFTIFFVRISSFLGDPARLFGLFGLFTPTDDAEGGAVGVENGNEAPDDVEAAAGPHVATDQQSAPGSVNHQRPVVEQPERPSQPRGGQGMADAPSNGAEEKTRRGPGR